MCSFDILEWLDATDDELTDYLLAQASEDYENTHALSATPTPTTPSHSSTASAARAGPVLSPSSAATPEQQTGATALPQHPTGAILPLSEALLQSNSTTSSPAVVNNAGTSPAQPSAQFLSSAFSSERQTGATVPLPGKAVIQSCGSRRASSAMRFATPKTNDEIVEARRQGIPKRTQQDTEYCKRLWEEWRNHRNTTTGENISPLIDLSESQLNHWLTCFILEVRKKDGSPYPPNTLHHLVAGLLRHMRENGRKEDLFKDPGFATFRASLDAEMKRLSKEGVGSKKKQAEIITEEEEELLWEKGVLGDETPQRLLDTVVFYNGLYFALRSGQEHRQLRRNPCQIEVVERPDERPYLIYTEDTSKNRPGGLKGHNIESKVVKHHANLELPQRCFLRIFKKYWSLCPPDAPESAFYLQPARTPTSTCWYSKRPLGHNTLAKTQLCRNSRL